MPYTCEQCQRIVDGVIEKYAGQDLFSRLIRERGKPAFPSAPREAAVFGIRHEGKETKFREDSADDTISLVRVDSDSLPQVYEYVGTTEPGLFDQVINAEGDFKLNPDSISSS